MNANATSVANRRRGFGIGWRSAFDVTSSGWPRCRAAGDWLNAREELLRDAMVILAGLGFLVATMVWLSPL